MTFSGGIAKRPMHQCMADVWNWALDQSAAHRDVSRETERTHPLNETWVRTMQSLFLDALVIGCGATLVMDIVALVLKRAFGLQPLDYGLVGRWILWRLRGEGVPRPISHVPPFRYERPIGWLLHYLIGLVFALAFLMVIGAGWAAAPSLLPALVFGALTVAAPFFILQPAFGAGVAARRTPRPGLARAKSLMAHLSFGAGIWLAAALWALLR